MNSLELLCCVIVFILPPSLPPFLPSFLPSFLSSFLPDLTSFVFFGSLLKTSSKMSCSQRDMFLSSPDQSPEKVPSSLPATLTYSYLWVILFDWCEDVEEPFGIFQIGFFAPNEIKKKWISGDLDLSSREKKLSFSALPGKTVSLFAKVEKCKS